MSKVSALTTTAVTVGPPVDIEPMEARSGLALPSDDGWQYEPKWDGFRCLAFNEGKNIDLRAKSGKPWVDTFPRF